MSLGMGADTVGSLNLSEFEALSCLAAKRGSLGGSARGALKETGPAMPTTDSGRGEAASRIAGREGTAVLSELAARGLVDARGITPAGLDALEPYRVRHAIILAAGRGERMRPATDARPKPMVRVNGVPIVSYALDALRAAGISDVHVVRGYRAEKLDPLRSAYPEIDFIDNPLYDRTNNITSLMAARHLLAGAYVMDSDLILHRPQLINPYQYRSNYLGIPLDRARGWCFETDGDGRITDAGPNVTRGVHQIVGISYWTPEDGARLAEDIPRALAQPGGPQRYWDTVAIATFPERYALHVRPCSADDVVELDTYEELCAVDASYRRAGGGRALEEERGTVAELRCCPA